MTTPEKCEAVLREILRRCNEEPDGSDWKIAFGRDWGGNSLTILDSSLGHTHIGGDWGPESTFDVLIDELYGQLINHKGLTWA